MHDSFNASISFTPLIRIVLGDKVCVCCVIVAIDFGIVQCNGALDGELASELAIDLRYISDLCIQSFVYLSADGELSAELETGAPREERHKVYFEP